MKVSFNCSVLSDTFEPLDSFSINIVNEENTKNIIAKLGNNHCEIKDFKVDHLKDYICERREVAVSNRYAVKLWKVDVEDEGDIKEIPKDEMKPRLLFKDYFQDELNEAKFTVTNIHVIAIIPTTGKCHPTFYLSNKEIAVTKYRVWSDLLFFALKIGPSQQGVSSK